MANRFYGSEIDILVKEKPIEYFCLLHTDYEGSNHLRFFYQNNPPPNEGCVIFCSQFLATIIPPAPKKQRTGFV